MKLKYVLYTPLILACLSLCACQVEEPLTLEEAQDAKTESALSTEVQAVISGDIELQTDMTLGDRAEIAIESYRAFYQSQLPCAEISVSELTLSIHFGTTGECMWQGKVWTGSKTIKIVELSAVSAHLQHEWKEVSNGSVKVSGTADVTWEAGDQSAVERRIEHELRWSRVTDRFERVGRGNRVQTLIDPSAGIAGGLEINGERSWTSPKGDWDMDIIGVQLRPQDPLPQAGRYEIINPKGKKLTLKFSREDEDTIRVDVESGRVQFDFKVDGPSER